MQPLISIIIPTYNRAHLIGETLDSVIAQTYINWECIVVDDGSTDYTEELIRFYCEKDSRIQFYHRPADLTKGANSCRNYGFELSNGELINWFDSDDIMLKNFIESRIQLFSAEIQLIIGGGIYVDEKMEEIGRMHINPDYHLFKGIILGKQAIITNSILFKRSFLEGRKLFNARVSRGEETEFFSRLFYQIDPKSYLIVNSPVFLYRQHAGTKTAFNEEYVKAYKESAAYIAAENIKRSNALQDKDLILHYYKQLVVLFLKGLENSHYSNSQYVFKSLLKILWKINKKLFLEFLIVGGFLLGIRRGSYQIGKRYREIQPFSN